MAEIFYSDSIAKWFHNFKGWLLSGSGHLIIIISMPKECVCEQEELISESVGVARAAMVALIIDGLVHQPIHLMARVSFSHQRTASLAEIYTS